MAVDPKPSRHGRSITSRCTPVEFHSLLVARFLVFGMAVFVAGLQICLTFRLVDHRIDTDDEIDASFKIRKSAMKTNNNNGSNNNGSNTSIHSSLLVQYGNGSVQKNTSSSYIWPQQDYSILQALRNGVRIGPVFDETTVVFEKNATGDDRYYYIWNNTKYYPPPKGLATVVTAYYEMNSKHSFVQYEDWNRNLLQATDPMIIFSDSTQTNPKNWTAFFEANRQHAPTLLVNLPFANLTMSKVFSDDFWKNYILPRDYRVRHKKGVDVYKIWNEKIILMREATFADPFETEFFYWIDSGYFRSRGFLPLRKPIVRNNITRHKVDGNRQLVFHRTEGYPTYEIAAGAFGGTPQAIRLHYDYYWKTFWYLVLYSDKECVGFEQRVMVWMCRSFPTLCVINYNENWIKMGRFWLRSVHYNFTKHQSFIPVDNTTTLPVLTQESLVSLVLPDLSSSKLSVVHEIPNGALSAEREMGYTHFYNENEGPNKQQRTRQRNRRRQQGT